MLYLMFSCFQNRLKCDLNDDQIVRFSSTLPLPSQNPSLHYQLHLLVTPSHSPTSQLLLSRCFDLLLLMVCHRNTFRQFSQCRTVATQHIRLVLNSFSGSHSASMFTENPAAPDQSYHFALLFPTEFLEPNNPIYILVHQPHLPIMLPIFKAHPKSCEDMLFFLFTLQLYFSLRFSKT